MTQNKAIQQLLSLIDDAETHFTDDGDDEAINAVRDYMVNKLLGGFDCKKAISSGYEWTLKDGRVVELRVTIKQPPKGE